MSDATHIKRQLKIKTGVVSRLLKENTLYREEATQLQNKVGKLVADGAEEWDIKNARNMFNESNKMIEDSGERLSKAVAELRDLVASVETDEAITQSEEFQNAIGALGNAEK